ncbi:MAG: transrane sensor [Pseudomonadota bacterium]|nr:transrane sensor [Pseudomonadota bacterium]
MMHKNDEAMRPGEEASLAALLRDVGPRADPPAAVARQIRAVVEAEWRAVVAARQPRPVVRSSARRWPALAMAASVAVAAIGSWFALPLLNQPATPLATLSRVSGAVEAGSDGDWQPAVVRQALGAGQAIVTGPQGRAALRLRDGVSLRLDTDTRVALLTPERIVVTRGAVYLDAGRGSGSADPLLIESRFGTTRHLGTQYEVRVAPDAMLVSVREGRVEVSGTGPVTQADAGEQVLLKADGSIQRQSVERTAALWDWTQEVTPPFAIEQRTLSEFLVWVSRETGREIEFGSPRLQSSAAEIVLRGSIAGLRPDAALAAVMATTPLDYTADRGLISVQPRAQQ